MQSPQPGQLQVGAVSYLNTKPLIWELDRLAPQADLHLEVPSRLADLLAARQLDVALIPCVEAFQDPEYEIVSDACIGCRGPVLSVKLLSRCPWHKIRTVALDEGSRTSVALTRILLLKRIGIAPQLTSLPLGWAPERVAADGVLVIGDRAIHSQQPEFPFQWDLGQEWVEWTGLPFVFAMWTKRSGVDLGELPNALSAARDRGLANLPQIAAREASRVQLSPAECLGYLRDNLHFTLGAREREGLERFRALAVELGLAPALSH